MLTLRERIGIWLVSLAFRSANAAAEFLCTYTELFGGPNGLIIDLPKRGMHINIRRVSGAALVETLVRYQKENARLLERVHELENVCRLSAQ